MQVEIRLYQRIWMVQVHLHMLHLALLSPFPVSQAQTHSSFFFASVHSRRDALLPLAYLHVDFNASYRITWLSRPVTRAHNGRVRCTRMASVFNAKLLKPRNHIRGPLNFASFLRGLKDLKYMTHPTQKHHIPPHTHLSRHLLLALLLFHLKQ